MKETVHALIMAMSDPSGDPRPRRNIELCKSLGFKITVLAFKPSVPLEGVMYHDIESYQLTIIQKLFREALGLMQKVFKFLKFYLLKYRYRYYFIYKVYKKKNEKVDLIIVENLELLPFAFDIKQNAKIIFDAREYYTKQYDDNKDFNKYIKPWRIKISRKYLKKCDAMTTVSKGLQREYKKEFGVEPSLYRSTPNWHDLVPKKVNSDNIRMVYMGGANQNRQLEKMLDLVNLLGERFTLDMFMVGNDEYQERIRQKALGNSRISFMPPVEFENIIPTLNEYDIGLAYFEPTSFNLTNCLPNKFFEYIQGRLVVAIGPTPDMADLVKKYKCGITSNEFTIESLANSINSLKDVDIKEMKENSHKAASELCFEKEREIMVSLIRDLLNSSDNFQISK